MSVLWQSTLQITGRNRRKRVRLTAEGYGFTLLPGPVDTPPLPPP